MKIRSKNKIGFKILLLGAFVFMMISQVEKSYLSIFKNSSFILLAICCFFCLLYNRAIFICKQIKYISILYITFFIFYFMMSVINSKNYLSDIYVYIFISYIILVFGYQITYILSREEIEHLFLIIGIIIVLFALYIFYLNYMNIDFVNEVYIYKEKNSIATLMASGLVLIFYLCHKKNIIIYISLIVLSIVVLLFKSRTTSIGFGFTIIIMLLMNIKQKLNKKKLITMVIIICFCIGIILVKQDLVSRWIEIFFLNNQDIHDTTLNAISGKRLGELPLFFNMFGIHPIIGNGYIYIESFPLSLLASYGIIGGVLVSIVLIYLFYDIYKQNRVASNSFCQCALSLLIIYYINAIAENLAPYGPGVKCFPLWIVVGLALKRERKSRYVIQ